MLYSQAASHRALTPLFTVLQLLARWKTIDTGTRMQARKIMRDAGLEEGDRASLAVIMSLIAPEQDEPSDADEITFAAQKAMLCDIMEGIARRRPVLLVVEDGEYLDLEVRDARCECLRRVIFCHTADGLCFCNGAPLLAKT